jgi:hypothetical protein
MEFNSGDYRHEDEMSASHRAAERVVPVILGFTGPVRSVVDVGGGDGGWLRVFQRHGVEDVLLIDCPEVAPHLVIDARYLQPCDLSRDLPPPRRFDLAMCLECAEHLPAHRARPLVEWLTKSADLVVFSAAIPGQIGKGHIHLQFPDFWSGLFSQYGYRKHDTLRPKILTDQAVAWWYRQNMVVFASPTAELPAGAVEFLPDEFYLIHRSIVAPPRGVKGLLRELGPAVISALRSRLGRRVV